MSCEKPCLNIEIASFIASRMVADFRPLNLDPADRVGLEADLWVRQCRDLFRDFG